MEKVSVKFLGGGRVAPGRCIQAGRWGLGYGTVTGAVEGALTSRERVKRPSRRLTADEAGRVR